jgi:hypothetical protein
VQDGYRKPPPPPRSTLGLDDDGHGLVLTWKLGEHGLEARWHR